MRTGPFSDPTVVTLINRYFVPFHMDNDDWSGPRYGIEPGQEDAYLLMETPDVPGVEKDHVLLGRLSQVLDPRNARRHILEFLETHPEIHHAWPELAPLEGRADAASRMRRAELLLEEGRTDEARESLDGLDGAKAVVLRARAYRVDGELDRAGEEMTRVSAAAMKKLWPEAEMEAIRIAVERGDDDMAAKMLDRLLTTGERLAAELAAEVHYLRGWAHHRMNQPERAIEVWMAGIERYPPPSALFSQKSYFTVIRSNWELPDNVDQPY